ncbi:DUF6912 family protein [Streptomyces aidingensis]|uniref:Uncharacterized protein n=1 Tax=Streptomyces aidingensis TaxID=910347 RepID=A0A1I1DX21_9ACTN|nr:hypothetical protein [Streptomyces aidingensis]SFB79451.1 hypothetical protein SAMN05421773_10117 [Streptomyces aidingensis]
MRVYVPLTLPALATLNSTGEVGPAPLTAYAVTPGLREWYLSGTEEELEYAAMGRAAQASLRLIAADLEIPPRRVVLAADVADGTVTPAADPGLGLDAVTLGEVRIAGTVPLAKCASVHVDGVDAEPDITAAAEALPAAEAGDEDARFVVDGAADHELLWYAVQELDSLL